VTTVCFGAASQRRTVDFFFRGRTGDRAFALASASRQKRSEIAATALFFSRPDRNERKSFPASPPPRQSRRRGKVPTARRTRARSSTRG
jgi:hypothetical protein